MNRKECLEEAIKLTTQDREAAYGTPEACFNTIAEYWNAYISSIKERPLKGFDVAAMMALLKIARIASSPTKEDNWVDLAGYAANGVEVSTEGSNGVEVVTNND